MVGEVKWSS